jgi:hypothetical protein
MKDLEEEKKEAPISQIMTKKKSPTEAVEAKQM